MRAKRKATSSAVKMVAAWRRDQKASNEGKIAEYKQIYKCIRDQGGKNGDWERGEWRLPGLLYADDLVLFSKSEEDLRAMVGHFVELCRRRGL